MFSQTATKLRQAWIYPRIPACDAQVFLSLWSAHARLPRHSHRDIAVCACVLGSVPLPTRAPARYLSPTLIYPQGWRAPVRICPAAPARLP